MPGRNWLDVIKELKEIRPSMPVLVVSMHNEEEYIIREEGDRVVLVVPKHAKRRERKEIFFLFFVCFADHPKGVFLLFTGFDTQSFLL